MNARRIIGLLLLAAIAAWLVLRGCSREPEPAPVPQAPVREEFHAAKPLRVEVVAAEGTAEARWLTRELRYAMSRGKMNLLPNDSRIVQLARNEAPRISTSELPQVESPPETAEARPFVLKVQLDASGAAALQLIAPDGAVERELRVPISRDSPLDTIVGVLDPLPKFLEATASDGGWARYLGIDDRQSYSVYLRSIAELFGPESHGFTRPPIERSRARTIERLERLTRRQPSFARAWAALALAYLTVGGQDEASLAQLAEASAERALELENDLPDAQAALGVVLLRRQAWLGAYERFERALLQEPEHLVALESLACMMVDAGQYAKALPLAERVVAEQPRNAGAHECLAYASVATDSVAAAKAATAPLASAKVLAMAAIWAGDRSRAQQLLRTAMSAPAYELWAAPMLRAAGQRNNVPQALQAITSAANEGYIDANTEILCGAALRQGDFVFNRMARVQLDDRAPPMRLLWLPQADFLRKHERFEEIVAAAGMPAFWHQHGPPDICTDVRTVADCFTKITAK